MLKGGLKPECGCIAFQLQGMQKGPQHSRLVHDTCASQRTIKYCPKNNRKSLTKILPTTTANENLNSN